jgi:hypothetical protein
MKSIGDDGRAYLKIKSKLNGFPRIYYIIIKNKLKTSCLYFNIKT